MDAPTGRFTVAALSVVRDRGLHREAVRFQGRMVVSGWLSRQDHCVGSERRCDLKVSFPGREKGFGLAGLTEVHVHQAQTEDAVMRRWPT